MQRNFFRQVTSIFLLGFMLVAFGCEQPDTGNGCGNQTPTPYVSAAGIGVSDLEASVQYFTEVLEMKVVDRRAGAVKGLLEEVVLEDYRGNKLYLMDYGDSRNYKDNPVKIVFGVPNADEYYERALKAGGTVLSRPVNLLGTKVGLSYELDGYIVEMIEAATLPSPIVAAIGIGAENLRNARSFYEDLGMVYDTQMPVTGLLREIIMVSSLEKGYQLVLMNFEDPKNYTDVPVKVVFNVDHSSAFVNAIKQGGGKVLVRPTANKVGYATDLYGSLLEIAIE